MFVPAEKVRPNHDILQRYRQFFVNKILLILARATFNAELLSAAEISIGAKIWDCNIIGTMEESKDTNQVDFALVLISWS